MARYSVNCRRCGKPFQSSPGGSTVNCPDCRSDIRSGAPKTSSVSSGGISRKPMPKTAKTMWLHLFDHHGGRMPANPGSISDEEKDALYQSIHEREHATRSDSLKHTH